jgi:hypothetical protein
VLDNIRLIYVPKFTGLILDYFDKTIFCLSYLEGAVTDFQQYGPEDIPNLKASLDNPDKKKDIILCCNDQQYDRFKSLLSQNGLRCINHIDPAYLNAFAASLSPFAKISTARSLLSRQDQKIIEQLHFKKLTLKSLVMLGTLFTVIYFMSLLLLLGLTKFHNRQREFSERIQFIIKQNQILKSENTKLWNTLNSFGQMNSNRTYLAYYLYQIASIIPPGLWLSEISINVKPEGWLEFHLFGYVPEEENVNHLLSKLEGLGFCRTLSLDQLGTVEGRDIDLRNFKTNHTLYMFKVCFHV